MYKYLEINIMESVPVEKYTNNRRQSMVQSEDGFHIQNQSPLQSEDEVSHGDKKGDDGLGIRVECSICNVRLGKWDYILIEKIDVH
jgi:hypothetical protein